MRTPGAYEATASPYRHEWGSPSTGQDGFVWKIDDESLHPELIMILKRSPEISRWELVSTIQRHLNFDDGIVVSP